MNMNTCSSISTPLKAMMACLHTLIFLILMKVVRNSNTCLISENQFLTFQAVSHIKIFWSEARKAESKRCTCGRSPWHRAGSESTFRDQQPTGAALNCDKKQDYPWTRKPVTGKHLERWSICMDSNICFGLQGKLSHQWKIFSRQPLGWQLIKAIFCVNIKSCTSSLHSWTECRISTCIFSALQDSSAPGMSCGCANNLPETQHCFLETWGALQNEQILLQQMSHRHK